MMTREDATRYLSTAYPSLQKMLGCSLPLDPYAPVIDSALRLLGFPEEELPWAVVEDEDVPAYIAALNYFMLLQYLGATVTLTDTTIDGVPINRSQIISNIKMLFEIAQGPLRSAGLLPSEAGASSDMFLGGINLDYLEPCL
jgi:hypothetical protein